MNTNITTWSAIVLSVLVALGGCAESPIDAMGGTDAAAAQGGNGAGSGGGSGGNGNASTGGNGGGGGSGNTSHLDSGTAPDARAADRAPDSSAKGADTSPVLKPGACKTNADCPSDQNCAYMTGHTSCAPDSFACTHGYNIYCDGAGSVCLPKPTACSAVISKVCSCDGKTYDNYCVMAMAGAHGALHEACPP